MFERDVGEMGESTLRNWASQVGITANKANQDKRGWDFILEFPIKKLAKNKYALDKIIEPIQCFIQVKATDNNNGSWSVKLSNWARLAKTSLPVFFLVLDYNNKNICQRAYLVHVWKKEIEKVLKKIREISVEFGSYDLNKKSMIFKWDEDNLISILNGEGLVKKIQSYINDYETYANRKKKIINNIGYKRTRKKIDLQILVPDSYDGLNLSEFFVDFNLGLVSDIKLNGGEIRDLRFNIPAPQPESIFEKGSNIEVVPEPVSEGILLFREKQDGHEIRIPAQFYAPTGVTEIVKFRDMKFLFKIFENNDIVLIPNKNNLKYNINLPDPFEQYALKCIHNISKIILFLSKSEKENIKEVEVFYSDRPITILKMKGILIPEKFIKWAKLINKTVKIAKNLDILNLINVKVIELWNQETQLDLMLMLLGLEDYCTKKLAIEFNCNGEVNSGDDFCIPFVNGVTIGKHKIFVVGAYLGRAIVLDDNHDKNYRIEIKKIEIKRKQILKRDEKPPKSIPEFIKEIEEKYIDNYYILNDLS